MSIMNIARRKYQEGGDAGTYAPGTPAPFLLPFGEALADYTMSELQQPIDIGAISPKVSYMNPLIQEALQKQATQAGLGDIQFDPNTGEVTGVAAYQPYLEKAEAAADPGAYKTYMSPYQTEVLDATEKLLAEQRAAGEKKAAEAAIASGAFGGGREGVQRAEYTRQRDIYDAGIMSKLRQEGLQQAQQLQQQSLKNQLGLGQAQAGFQSGITSGLGAAGTGAQAYSQSILDAIQQQNMLGQQFPMQKIGSAANIFAGVAGGIPGQVQPPITTSPGLTGIQTFGSIFGGLGNLVRGR